ncbi:unnamed protein product [Rhizophagus irregularis]|nr:unnamed protein product [Rhizophagus irregularis]
MSSLKRCFTECSSGSDRISSLVYAPPEDDKILVLKQWGKIQKNNRRILTKLKKFIVPFQNKNETLGKGGGKAPGIEIEAASEYLFGLW